MSKQKFKITNWPAYNKALRQRGSLTVWLDESAIAAWTDNALPEGRGRPLHYTDMAITTVLMMKRVFNLPLRALQGFVDSIFKLMELPLCCPDYSLVSKQAKRVSISIKTPTRGEISHLVIDSTGLKVFGEGEWKVRQHGADKRRVWRKLHLAADRATHEIICADLSLSGTTDAQALPGLINQTHRKIREASADGAYDTRYCHDVLLRKKIRPLIPPRNGAQYWPDKYHTRNHAVANQHLSGSNDLWKKKVDYHRRSVAETAMFRIKTLLGSNLSLRDYDAQVGEAMAMVKALNRMTLLGMPHSVRSA
ncbi:IS5 family transposase [Salmonella enterica]|nr:IS5 family transposase [Salmonella enterica]EIP1620042.1 IS5 family transposase [Salmonella enterica]